MTNLQAKKNLVDGLINLYIVCKQDQDLAGMEKYKNEIQAVEAEIKALEVAPVEEAPKGITLVARLKCQVTGTVRIETSNEYQNKNQFRKALKSWSDTTIQAISDNRDLEAMEAGFKNFLELKKEAQRFNFQYKEGREYNRILNEVAL